MIVNDLFLFSQNTNWRLLNSVNEMFFIDILDIPDGSFHDIFEIVGPFLYSRALSNDCFYIRIHKKLTLVASKIPKRVIKNI